MRALIENRAATQGLQFQSDIQKLSNLKDKSKALQMASREFEAIFLTHMLKGMRQSVLGEGGGIMGGSGFGGGVFQELFEVEVARKASHRQSLGMAKVLYEQMSKLLPADAAGDEPAAGSLSLPAIPRRERPEPKAEVVTAVRVEPKPKAEVVAAGQAEPEPKAEAALIKTNAVKPDAGTVDGRLKNLEPIIDRAARTYRIDPDLIKAVIAQESSARPDSVSSAGAKGLMQLMDGTARDLGVQDPFDPEENIKGGTRYLRWLLDRFGGEEKLALASYNAGPGRVKQYGGVPPFPETERYVDRVLTKRQEFKNQEIK
jgi:soluble lytic murein transglycosylase-like protein